MPLSNDPRRHAPVRKNEFHKVNDDLESRILQYPHQVIFLIESTFNATKYIDIYKETVTQTSEDGNCDYTIVIDRNILVDSLENKCAEKDEGYRSIRERAKSFLHNNHNSGYLPTKLMVQLTRYTIVVALEAYGQKWNIGTDERNAILQPSVVNIMLTNFIDLAFITEFLNTKIKVDALVKLNCRKISRIRDKFVSSSSRVERAITDKVIRQFWQDFYDGLNIENMASVFKDILIYEYESKYNANYEPPDVNQIIAMSRKFVKREIDQVQQFILNIKIEYDKFVKDLNPLYALTVNEDCSYYYESYNGHLSKYPEESINVPLIIDAIIKAINPQQSIKDFVDAYFDAYKNESDNGCMSYPVSVQYGNECALTVKKHDLRLTDYSVSMLSLLNIRWKKLLWGSRPFIPLTIEVEYDKFISNIKCQCENSAIDDYNVDVQLCVLGMNRLRTNLDVFRGENIGLSGLDMTKVMFKPGLIEPIGCSTMVQMLEKESENYKKMCYAYFEPEDVVLLKFYDFQESSNWKCESSFDFTVPQGSIYAKDYFDYFYNKKTPKCFYAMQDATNRLCTTYREKTENVHFRDGDCLTVTKRKWRFESETVCLVYKSKLYEIIRHITNDVLDDRFRIYTNEDCEYYIEKYQENVVDFTYYAADGGCTKIVSGMGTAAAICLLRQSIKATNANRAFGRRVEECRIYTNNGQVVIEYDDKTTVTHLASGKAEDPKLQITDPKTLSTIFNTFSEKEHHKSRSVIGIAASHTNTSSDRNKNNTATKPEEDDFDDFLVKYSYDGMRKIVKFDDGTSITTHVREVYQEEEPDWVCYVVTRYEYAHPAYRTVTKDNDGSLRVQDLIKRSSDGCLQLQLFRYSPRDSADVVRTVKVTNDLINMYTEDVSDFGDESKKVVSFGWKNSDVFLFEKHQGPRQESVTTVAYDKLQNRCTLQHHATWSRTDSSPTAGTYFIIKRFMSGFRLLDGNEYDEFVKKIRDLDHTVIRENRDDVIMLFTQDDSITKTDNGAISNRSHTGYEWLKVSLGKQKLIETVAVPKQLIFRVFKKCGTDYGPILNALRNTDNVICNTFRQMMTDPAAKLIVRINNPKIESVKAMYEIRAGLRMSFWYDLLRDNSFTQTLLAHTVRLSVRRVRRKQEQRDALEALTRMKNNSFIPYFRYNSYGPLRKYLIANNLSYSL